MNFMNDPIIAARMRTLMQQQSIQQDQQPASSIDSVSIGDPNTNIASSNIDSLMSTQAAQMDAMMRRQMMHNSRMMGPPSEFIPNNLPMLPPMRGQRCGTTPRPYYPSMPPQFGSQVSNSSAQTLPAQSVWPGTNYPTLPTPFGGNTSTSNNANIPKSLDDLSAMYQGNLSAQIFKDLGSNSIPKSILAFSAASEADMRYRNNQLNREMNLENANGGYGIIGMINKISGAYNNYGSGASNYSNIMLNAGYGNSASNMNNNAYDYASMFQ